MFCKLILFKISNYLKLQECGRFFAIIKKMQLFFTTNLFSICRDKHIASVDKLLMIKNRELAQHYANGKKLEITYNQLVKSYFPEIFIQFVPTFEKYKFVYETRQPHLINIRRRSSNNTTLLLEYFEHKYDSVAYALYKPFEKELVKYRKTRSQIVKALHEYFLEKYAKGLFELDIISHPFIKHSKTIYKVQNLNVIMELRKYFNDIYLINKWFLHQNYVAIFYIIDEITDFYPIFRNVTDFELFKLAVDRYNGTDDYHNIKQSVLRKPQKFIDYFYQKHTNRIGTLLKYYCRQFNLVKCHEILLHFPIICGNCNNKNH